MTLPHLTTQRQRKDNGNQAQTGNNSQKGPEYFDGLQIDFVHPLIRRRFHQVAGSKHVKEEWRVVRGSGDIKRVARHQMLIAFAARNGLKLGKFGESRRQNRCEFHRLGDISNPLNIVVAEWTLRYQNRRDAVLTSLAAVLFADD